MRGDLTVAAFGDEVDAIDRATEVQPELVLGGHEQHVPVVTAVDLVADAVTHAGGAGGATYPAIVGIAGHLRLRALVRPMPFDVEPVHCCRRLALRNVYPGALSGGPRPQNRGEHCGCGE